MGAATVIAALSIAAADLKVKDVMREIAADKVIYNKGFAANRFERSPKAVACVSAAMTAVFLLTAARGRAGGETGAHKAGQGPGDAFILGGALSNTYERIVHGKVTDYIPLGRYVYNIADLAIYAGCVLKLLPFLFKHKN